MKRNYRNEGRKKGQERDETQPKREQLKKRKSRPS